MKFFFLAIIVFLLSAGPVLAVDASLPRITNPFDTLSIGIPNMERFSDATYGTSVVTVPWIAEYVRGIFNYGIGIIGVAAVIGVAVGGLYWTVSAGNSGRVSKAKGWIMDSLLGLAIALGSYLIMYSVNQDLVSFKSVNLNTVQRKELDLDNMDNLDFAVDGSDSESQTTANPRTCADSSTLITLDANSTHCDYFNAKELLITQQLATELTKVCDAAHAQGLKVSINSAYRTMAWQTQLYNDAVAKHGADAGKWVAKPSCNAPHVAGIAIDAAPSPKNDTNVAALQAVFKSAGWGRYCPEAWHFQPPYDKKGANC